MNQTLFSQENRLQIRLNSFFPFQPFPVFFSTQVLTHNIASCLGITNAHTVFDTKFQATTNVTFDEYSNFLKQSVFARLTEASSSINLSRIDEVCWFICGPHYLQNRAPAISGNSTRRLLKEKNALKLWRVFNVLAEVDPSSSSSSNEDVEEVLVPVGMDWEEVLGLAQRIFRLTGSEFDRNWWREFLEPTKTFKFVQLLDVVESRCLHEADKATTTMVIDELYEENILGVLKKVMQ